MGGRCQLAAFILGQAPANGLAGRAPFSTRRKLGHRVFILQPLGACVGQSSWTKRALASSQIYGIIRFSFRVGFSIVLRRSFADALLSVLGAAMAQWGWAAGCLQSGEVSVCGPGLSRAVFSLAESGKWLLKLLKNWTNLKPILLNAEDCFVVPFEPHAEEHHAVLLLDPACA